jgi:hypothetical protein
MRETNEKVLRFLEILPRAVRSFRLAGQSAFLLSSLLGLALLLTSTFGCGSSTSQGEGGQNSTVSNDVPELTEEMIRERINYAYVRKVPEDEGNGEPISWTFVHE